jgi:hypothetical protein
LNIDFRPPLNFPNNNNKQASERTNPGKMPYDELIKSLHHCIEHVIKSLEIMTLGINTRILIMEKTQFLAAFC